jgi:hypothetical protein
MSLKQSKKAIHKAIGDVRNYRGNQVQVDFWPKFGVTQSGGSRYENGRQMDTPLRMLMALHAAGRITDTDLGDLRAIV